MNQPNDARRSVLYQNSSKVPFASRISWMVRRKIFDLFMDRLSPGPDTTVLDVGVTNDTTFRESNFFEQLYPRPWRITCIGTEDGSHLVDQYPGLRYEQVRPGERLPFRDRQFDIVFSNAVVEHVGQRELQRAFVHEIRRVGSAFFITTPNRWFPVEHHTGLPLLHFLPPTMFRALIQGSRYDFWAQPQNLNILTAAQFQGLFENDCRTEMLRVRLCGFTSNLVAIGLSGQRS